MGAEGWGWIGLRAPTIWCATWSWWVSLRFAPGCRGGGRLVTGGLKRSGAHHRNIGPKLVGATGEDERMSGCGGVPIRAARPVKRAAAGRRLGIEVVDL